MGMFAAQDLAQGQASAVVIEARSRLRAVAHHVESFLWIQVLFTVPDRLILRPPSDERDSAGGLSSQAVLALQILYERQLGPKSALYPYIK